ncbi:2Fe-2S iron-sulfur cluster-binding protein [Hymenobacter sp. GOD-10R]|uniref:2Fe-2S iron-sulfur cluster-binding protein n=1 Tax=Hymenobacter sp. GOD-10R TaxID=3093922 RepID=UPI002D77B245|nr:2Fe-2S iron-sulfur cluster-binding protein [Hymenobacter sp. GOD-10R]WRQ28038.1 2Fe-2S iron-sulfur cluster-binding protein [Hymenobacter sp. GOD-10R]
MPTLLIENLASGALPVPAGATLLSALQTAGHDWLHACGGRGRCTTCRLEVVEGLDLLTPLTEAELRYRAAGRLLAHERLTCQARLCEGAVTGRVPHATKLPHVSYSD